MEETINARQRTSQVKLLNGTVVQRYLYKQVCKNIMSKLALVTVFKSISFFSNFIDCRFFSLVVLLFKHLFIHRSNFLSRLPRFIRFSSKSNGIHSKWWIVPVGYLRNK